MNIPAQAKRDIYLDSSKRTIQFAALLLLPSLLVLFAGIKLGYINDSYYHSDALFGVVAVAVTALSMWLYTTQGHKMRVHAVQAALFHMLGIVFILFILGFNNPFILIWALLLVVTDMFFGKTAYVLSALLLLVTGALHVVRLETITMVEAGTTFVTALVVIAISYSVSKLLSIDQEERMAFTKTRQQTLLQRDRMTTLINAMSDAVISTDKKGIIRMYNAAALNLLDTNTSLSGQSIHTVLNLYNENGDSTSLTEVLKTTPRIVLRDMSHKLSDGETINVSISIAPVNPTYRQKAQHGFIFVLRDITKEKSLEDERDEFISVVSHELRTPVAIAEGNLSNVKFLMERGEEAKTLTGAIDGAHDQVLYLAKMVNDLSTLSRAERGVADAPEEIEINDMLEALYSEYRPQAEAKNLSLNLDVHGKLGSVTASRLYLEEILQNFITNSIKYTKTGSVTIGAKKMTGEKVEFWVKDTGIGMSKADQKHIFEKFYRSEDYRTRETNGTGLGLYVVQKLARKLNVSVELSSRLNHGSCFSFTMPRSK